MDDLTLVIKTHSDYSYLWPIIDDYIKNIKLKKLLFHNKSENLPKNFDQNIEYDENLSFNQRILNGIKFIDSKYILFVPDIDIILNLNIDVLKNYIDIMEEYNIERVNTAVFDGLKYYSKNGYALCDLNKCLIQKSNHFVPVDCHPVIWKKETWIKILNIFNDNGYNSSDTCKKYIDYCKKNVKCFGIQKTNNFKIKYNRGLTNSENLDWLHITTKGKFLIPFQCYHDYKKDLEIIIKKYKLDVKKIGISKCPKSCIVFNKLKI